MGIFGHPILQACRDCLWDLSRHPLPRGWQNLRAPPHCPPREPPPASWQSLLGGQSRRSRPSPQRPTPGPARLGWLHPERTSLGGARPRALPVGGSSDLGQPPGPLAPRAGTALCPRSCCWLRRDRAPRGRGGRNGGVTTWARPAGNALAQPDIRAHRGPCAQDRLGGPLRGDPRRPGGRATAAAKGTN